MSSWNSAAREEDALGTQPDPTYVPVEGLGLFQVPGATVKSGT